MKSVLDQCLDDAAESVWGNPKPKKMDKFELAKDLRQRWDEAFDKCNGNRGSEVWRELYDYVFSDNISMKVWNEFPDFHYSDPDASYYDDVTAFITAFEDYVKTE